MADQQLETRSGTASAPEAGAPESCGPAVHEAGGLRRSQDRPAALAGGGAPGESAASKPQANAGGCPVAGGLSALGAFVARHRRNLPVRKLAGICRRYLSWYDNANHDPHTNGEAFVLQALASFKPRIIFDVGANTGRWSRAARQFCPSAQVHAFEISPPTFAALQATAAGLSGVTCRNVGLSDAPGIIQIRHYAAIPELTTATDYPHPLPFTQIPAQVMTGDQYAADHGIDPIDFLKIDVEGMEERVLKGFSGMFTRRAIDLVQFEYGRVNILNRFLLRDSHDFFRRHGYVVGKVFPNYVDFRGYELWDEDFVGPNFLACRTDRADLRAALGCAGGPGD